MRGPLEGGHPALQACRRRASSGAGQCHRRQALQTTPATRHPRTTPSNQPCHARASGGRASRPPSVPKARKQRRRPMPPQASAPDNANKAPPPNNAIKPALPCEGLSGRRASRPPSVPKARKQRSHPKPPQASVPDNANKAPAPSNATNKPASNPSARGVGGICSLAPVRLDLPVRGCCRHRAGA